MKEATKLVASFVALSFGISRFLCGSRNLKFRTAKTYAFLYVQKGSTLTGEAFAYPCNRMGFS